MTKKKASAKGYPLWVLCQFEFGKLEKTSIFSLIHHKESEQKDFICVCSKSPDSRAEPNSNQTSKRQTSADHYNLMYYQILYF